MYEFVSVNYEGSEDFQKLLDAPARPCCSQGASPSSHVHLGDGNALPHSSDDPSASKRGTLEILQ